MALSGDVNPGAPVCPGTGGLFNSGSITTSGGDGTTLGGTAGSITLDGENCSGRGSLRNSGALTANGGNATSGNGGNGNLLTLAAKGQLLHSATLSANGGTGSAAGGSGGRIQVANAFVPEDPNNEVRVAGSLSANGGNGATGGSASVIPFSTISAGGVDVHLLNFIQVHLHGGSSTTGTGGTGGTLAITASDYRNDLFLHAPGGTATGAGSRGGDGGGLTATSPTVVNFGKVVTDGGGGVDRGGNAGSMSFFPTAVIINAAELSAKGGAATNAAVGPGGDGGDIGMHATKSINNSGAINSSGGDHPDGGGDGGIVVLNAVGKTVNTAAITSNGGNAATTAGTDGGGGGAIDLATKEQPTINTGTLSVIKGAGSATSVGVEGVILIDGSNVTPTTGTLP